MAVEVLVGHAGSHPTHPFYLTVAGRFLFRSRRCHLSSTEPPVREFPIVRVRLARHPPQPRFYAQLRGAMPSVQSFTIACEALNDHGTFSEGDVLRGKVTLALIKQISAESMFVKVTGDASVHWTKRVNDRTYTYSADHRYFKLKQPLIPEWAKGRW